MSLHSNCCSSSSPTILPSTGSIPSLSRKASTSAVGGPLCPHTLDHRVIQTVSRNHFFARMAASVKQPHRFAETSRARYQTSPHIAPPGSRTKGSVIASNRDNVAIKAIVKLRPIGPYRPHSCGNGCYRPPYPSGDVRPHHFRPTFRTVQDDAPQNDSNRLPHTATRPSPCARVK